MSKLNMTAKIASIMGASLLAFSAMGIIATHTVDQAQAQDPAARQFTSATGAVVLEAQNFMQSNQYSAAASKLQEAIALPNLNAYERSVIYQMMGASYYETNQYGPAITAFENSINAGGLLPAEADGLRVNVAQLLIANEQYAEGARRLENYLNRGGQEKPQYIEMLTQAWVQANQYSKALPWAEKWFNRASPKERKHFDLMNFLYNNLGMQGRQADIVKQMINRWPEDKTLWDAWASMLANGGREQEAFEVTKMLYLGGALNSESDLMKVVQYYSFYDMPFQAAQILEREMNQNRISRSSEKLKQLSTLFRQAREYERAIPILEQAASSSGDGKLYADLGEALYNEGQCKKSEDAFKQAINRGYDAGKSWMLIATCRYEATQKQERLSCGMTSDQMASAPITRSRQAAVEAFRNVPSSSREGRNAKKWIQFIEAERDAVDRRCEFERNVEEELCYQKIKGAYAEEVFVGKLVIPSECTRFKDAYDAKYRVKIVE